MQGIPPTIFTTMSQLAVQTGAVNLGQGFPDEDGPTSVQRRAVEAITNGAENQYPPGRGRLALLQAIAAHQHRHYGIELDPASQVLVTTGCTEGIAAAILGLVNPGDEVIVIEPFYDSYPAMIHMAGGTRVPVTLRAPDFRLDPAELHAAVTSRTSVIMVNTPHNPTGRVLEADELAAVAEVAAEHDLVVISDEVYEHLTFDAPHTPLTTLPGLAERTITLSSVGKSFSFTGWKVGWVTGPVHLVDAVSAAKQWLTFTSGGPLQSAVAHALQHEDLWPRELAASLKERRDLLVDGLNDLGLPTHRPQGTYFAVSDLSSLDLGSGMQFCLDLPARAGVVAIPLSAFYDSSAGDHLVRWAFCKERLVIEDALQRLRDSHLT